MRYERDGFVEAEDGTRLFCEELGEGSPPIVLTDGIGCDGFVWRYLMPSLARHHRVVHWHFRGHGRSGPPRNPEQLSIEDLARDLRSVCRHLDVERPVIANASAADARTKLLGSFSSARRASAAVALPPR